MTRDMTNGYKHKQLSDIISLVLCETLDIISLYYCPPTILDHPLFILSSFFFPPNSILQWKEDSVWLHSTNFLDIQLNSTLNTV